MQRDFVNDIGSNPCTELITASGGGAKPLI